MIIAGRTALASFFQLLVSNSFGSKYHLNVKTSFKAISASYCIPSASISLGCMEISKAQWNSFDIACSQQGKNEMKKTGGGPPTQEYTPAEELALCNNGGHYKKIDRESRSGLLGSEHSCPPKEGTSANEDAFYQEN